MNTALHATSSAPSSRVSQGLPRLDAWAPWLAGALLCLPVVATHFPPMIDVPLHEAIVGMLRHFNDASFYPEGLYFRNLGHPNQLFYLLAWALSYPLPIDAAVKCVICATLIAIPVAGARFADHLGAPRWVGVLVAPVAIGWLFVWGLIANLIGFAGLLAFLPLLDDYMKEPSAKRAAKVAGAVVVLYLAHEGVLVMFAAASCFFALVYAQSLRGLLVRFAPAALALVLGVGERIYVQDLITPSTMTVPYMRTRVAVKLMTLPGALFGAYEPLIVNLLFALNLAAVGVLLAARVGQARAAEGRPRSSVRERLRHFRFELFGLALFAAYLSAPLTFHGATLVYHRFLAPAYALLAICSAPRHSKASLPLARTLVLLLPVATLLVMWPSFVEVAAGHEALDHVFARIDRGSSVAQLEVGTPDSTNIHMNLAAAGRLPAIRGGRMLYGFTESAVSPVMVTPKYRWDDATQRIVPDAWSFIPSFDLRRFRYVIVHSAAAQPSYWAQLALAPEARLVMTEGEWSLFESTLPVVPLASPDVVPPPGLETLRSRLDRLYPPNRPARGAFRP